jgi:hypothetical protein
MTFVVVAKGASQEKVVGTIWADGEQQAQDVASTVCTCQPDESIQLRRGEIREIPLKLAN